MKSDSCIKWKTKCKNEERFNEKRIHSFFFRANFARSLEDNPLSRNNVRHYR